MEGENWKTINREGFTAASFWARWGKWIGAVLIVALVMSVFGVLNWQRSVRAQGETYQYNVGAKYQNVQTQLGTCLDNTVLSAQIAEQERQSLKETLTAVIQARYTNSNGETLDITSTDGQALAIRVLQEAYPNVSPDLYKQLMTVAVGCRNQVAGVQQDLQIYAANFKSWTKSGSFLGGIIRESFPNGSLKVQGLNGELTGQAALDFITEPITTQAASDAMKNKQMPEQTLFPSAAPTPNR